MEGIAEKKDHRQVVRAQHLFKHRMQNFKNVYGQSQALGLFLGLEGSGELSEEQKKILAAVDGEATTEKKEEELTPAQLATALRLYPVTFGNHPGAPAESPTPGKLYDLWSEKHALLEELRFAQTTAEHVDHIVSKNAERLREEKREMEAMKAAMAAAMDGFTKMKQSLVVQHKHLEKKCSDLVSAETGEREQVRQNSEALEVLLDGMRGELRAVGQGVREQFKKLAGEFQYVRNETEVNASMLRERQRQFRDYREVLRKFNTLTQSIHYMEERTKATRNKFQQLQISLVSTQKALAEAKELKGKLESEWSGTEAEWTAQQHVWDIERSAIQEEFRNERMAKDREWMDEREDLFSIKKGMGETLFAARNKAEDLADELALIRAKMEDEKEELAKARVTLENCEAENDELTEELGRKTDMKVEYARSLERKDAEKERLTQKVYEQDKKLQKELERKRKRFTLKRFVDKYFDDKIRRAIETMPSNKELEKLAGEC